MRSEDDVVEALRRAHRAAADQVDERPDPSVRAAVLAAAARAVDAKPRSATNPPDDARAPTRRWPLSAAAVLVVSAVTALLASQVLRDEPERITTMASATQAQPRAAASAPPPAAAVPAAPENQVVDRHEPARRVEAARAPKVAQRPQRPVEREALVEPRGREAPTPSPTTPTRPPPTAAPEPASSAAADSASAESRETRAATGAGIAPPALLAPAPVQARRQVGRAAEPGSPEAWVERIVRLRTEGHDSEADRELEGLRRRYPGFEIPAGALATPGGR